jgi:hypothetical protein
MRPSGIMGRMERELKLMDINVRSLAMSFSSIGGENGHVRGFQLI